MSSSTLIIRLILEVLGLIAIGAGIVGGIVTMFREIALKNEQERLTAINDLTAFIQALIQLVQALVKAPLWLALVIVGIVIVISGNLVA
jgi:hypothetical protein